jgi:hypothetical protein
MSVMSMSDRGRRTRLLVGLLFITAAFAVSAVSAPRAEAGSAYFCFNETLSSGGNCHDPYTRYLNYVEGWFNTSTVRTCAGAKDSALNGNVIPFVCDNVAGGYARTGKWLCCSTIGRATVHNGSPNGHSGFYGAVYYY